MLSPKDLQSGEEMFSAANVITAPSGVLRGKHTRAAQTCKQAKPNEHTRAHKHVTCAETGSLERGRTRTFNQS